MHVPLPNSLSSSVLLPMPVGILSRELLPHSYSTLLCLLLDKRQGPLQQERQRGGGTYLWQPKEPEIPTGILRLSKEDHSVLTPALPFPSLHALFFLPISPPVLINICFIHLIPMEVWQQVAKSKIYKINECEEAHEARAQGKQ